MKNALPHSVEPSPYPPDYKWKVMGTVITGIFMSSLNASIINVSIPKIMADLGANVDDVEWVLTGYMLAFAALMPLTGWLRDRIGYKNIYIWALSIFTLGSLLCVIAWNLPFLIAARVIQALGGGAMLPTGMAMMTEVFPIKERGNALGIYYAGSVLGAAIGPAIGGFMTDYFGWRSIFLINLPIGIVTIIASIEFLMKDAAHKLVKKSFDIWGFVFLAVFLVSLLLGMSKGEKEGWMSVFIITCFIISALSLIGFILVGTHVDNPIVTLGLFKIPIFAAVSVITVTRTIGLYATTFLLPIFSQEVMGMTAFQSGLLLLPASLFMGLLFLPTGFLADKIGPKIPAITGLVLVAYSLYLYGSLDVNTSIWGIMFPLMIRSLGVSLLLSPIMTSMMNSVPQNRLAESASINNILQQVGASLGVAFLGALLSHRTTFHTAVAGQSIKATDPAFLSVIGNVMDHVHGFGFSHGQAYAISKGMVTQAVIRSAVIKSYQDTFFVGGIVVLLSIPFALFLPWGLVRRKHGHTLDREEIEELPVEVIID